MYSEVARALVTALQLSAAARVADLGAGTGASTQAVLAALGPDGRVVGVDPAERMVTAARQRITDPRARFVVGDASALVTMPEAPLDAALASSVIWLCPSLPEALAALHAALRPGGRLGLSVPAEYLGESQHLLSPSALRVAAALTDLRAAAPSHAAQPPAPTPLPTGLGRLDAFETALAESGFSHVAASLFSRVSPAEEQLAWLGQPVVLSGLLGSDDPATLERARGRLRAKLQPEIAPDFAVEQRWFLVTATRP
ncbi:MAG: methyltransferase domain-containing protein [Myxococcota bacterium]